MTNQKYPDADTSLDRLNAIADLYSNTNEEIFVTRDIVRDLLAMVQLRWGYQITAEDHLFMEIMGESCPETEPMDPIELRQERAEKLLKEFRKLRARIKELEPKEPPPMARLLKHELHEAFIQEFWPQLDALRKRGIQEGKYPSYQEYGAVIRAAQKWWFDKAGFSILGSTALIMIKEGDKFVSKE